MNRYSKVRPNTPLLYQLKEKEEKLQGLLKRYARTIVAFSGGVDSSYLAVMAFQTLGKNMLAITALSPSFPAWMHKQIQQLLTAFPMPHRWLQTQELANPYYVSNLGDRCFYCKDELFSRLVRIAKEEGYQVVLEGSQASDEGDHRPGMKAAAKWGIKSPLKMLGFTKEEIRYLSKQRGLPTWDQPESPCLASRIPVGEVVTEEKLKMVEKGEAFLRELGFRRVRLRHHSNLARIEVAKEEWNKLLDQGVLEKIHQGLKRLGFHHVTLDLGGYQRGGGVNRKIEKNKEVLL